MIKTNILGGIFKKLKKPEGSLTGRAFAGSFWLFALRGAYEVFYLIRIVIIARILAPRDFGVAQSQRLTSYRPRGYIRVFLFPVIGSFVVMASIKGCQAMGSHGIVGFSLTVLVGLIVYLALALVWEKRFNYQISFFLRKGMILINGS